MDITLNTVKYWTEILHGMDYNELMELKQWQNSLHPVFINALLYELFLKLLNKKKSLVPPVKVMLSVDDVKEINFDKYKIFKYKT
mgnify:CR=1 FL=1